jgi:4'-phosphopantetheinyl transferase
MSIPSTSDIHMWRAWLKLPPFLMYQFERTLSEDEHKRAACFHFEHDRDRFIIARGILRMILGSYLDIQPQEIHFAYNSYGKPGLSHNLTATAIQFNVSHSNELALYAFTCESEIGIDVEFVSPLLDEKEIANRFFSHREYTSYCQVSSNQKLNAFYNCWTRKEAYIKAIGNGLTHPLDSFEVSLIPSESPRILNIDGDKQKASEWTMIDLSPLPGYIAACAIKRKNLKLTWLDYEDLLSIYVNK